MKKSIFVLVTISLFISACTTQKLASSYGSDDVYNTSSNSAPRSKTTITKTSSSLADDYTDYSYSDRINRFNNQDTTKGYFDQSTTSGTGNDNSWNSGPDVNLYLGFGAGYGGYWGAPYYSWGYPYNNWGWDWGWGYGWGYGYPYYNWYNPWYNPYNCCFCYGYNDWYGGGYYQYYSTNTYYGPRRSLNSSDGTGFSRNSRVPSTFSDQTSKRNERTTGINQNTRGTGSQAYTRNGAQSSTRATSANQEKYRYTRSSNSRQLPAARGASQAQGQRQQPLPRYTRQENVVPAQRTGSAQSYSSPAYRQPKSSQEYISPRTQNPGATRTTPSSYGNRGTSVPSTGSGTRVSPSNNTRTYSSPSRSNNSYSSPSRSGSGNYNSSPSRSSGSGSYSAPSSPRSSGSYSAPSRSGGGGGSAPSGGSSGGGGGRRR